MSVSKTPFFISEGLGVFLSSLRKAVCFTGLLLLFSLPSTPTLRADSVQISYPAELGLSTTFKDQDGQNVANGILLRAGTFTNLSFFTTLTNTSASASQVLAALEANFTPYGSTFFTNNVNLGLISASPSQLATVGTNVASPIYLLLYNTSSTKTYRDWETDRKSTRLNSSHSAKSRMPSSA